MTAFNERHSCASRPLAMAMISLNCLIHGEVPAKMFTVEVEKTKNVSILKKLIKEEKASRLEHVDASDLDLWMVDLRLDDLGAEQVLINLDTYQKLSPHKTLSSFLDHIMDDDHLHIIAKTPGMLR